jgi:hypothetical protein
VQRIDLLDYDSQGRLVRTVSASPRGRVERTWETEYDVRGQKIRMTAMWGGWQGARRMETRLRGRWATTRVFDQDSNLLTMAGDIPPEQAPPGGWGKAKDGLALHLSVSPARSRPVGIRVGLTALDTIRRIAQPYVAVFPYLDLRDSGGRPVNPTSAYVARRNRYRLARGPGASGPCDTRGWLAGSNGMWEMDLMETCGDLPAGRYSIAARACLDGSGARSNVVDLVVDPPLKQ